MERALVLEPANRPLKEELQALTLLLKKEKPETPLKVVPKASPKVTATERPIRRRILIEEIGEAEPLLVSKDEASPSDQPMVPPAAEETLAPALKSLSLVTKESLSPPTSLLDFERDYASLKQDLSLWSAYVRVGTLSFFKLYDCQTNSGLYHR